MHPDRPVNLPLPRLAAAMPVTAITSFLHRITGVVLFAGTLFLCYVLDLALSDAAGFERAAAIIEAPPGALATWAILTSLAYHVVAGVKHLLLDFHVGDTLRAGRIGAWLTIALAVAAAVGLAVWLW